MTQTSDAQTAEAVLDAPMVMHRETGGSIVRRFGSALFLFALVLAVLLSISWVFILPRVTRIRLQGQTVDLSVVVPYEQKLKAQITSLESKRDVLVLPIKDATYDTLKKESLCYPTLQDLQNQIAKTANDTAKNAVVFSGLSFDDAGNLTLEGDVRNVGPRSMTVLAQFVDHLHKLPFISSFTAPAFNRVKDATGFHSPFSIAITITPSETCPSAQLHE